MAEARLFACRWSSASTKEVYIEKQGDSVALRPKPDNLAERWCDFFESSEPFPDDFLADRMDAPPQERKWFDDVDA